MKNDRENGGIKGSIRMDNYKDVSAHHVNPNIIVSNPRRLISPLIFTRQTYPIPAIVVRRVSGR